MHVHGCASAEPSAAQYGSTRGTFQGWARSVSYIGYIGTWGIFGGRTELTEVSGTGIEVVQILPAAGCVYRYRIHIPNHTGVFGRVLRPYRTPSVG